MVKPEPEFPRNAPGTQAGPILEADRTVAERLETVADALQIPLGTAALVPLSGDGSDRRFYRLRSGRHRLVLVSSPRNTRTGLDENDSYALIGRHLAARGVPVPAFKWADPGRGFFVLEDLGDLHLQDLARRRRDRRRLERLYEHALHLLLSMHDKAREGFHAGLCFDGAVSSPGFVYERELDYFRQRFLNQYLGLEIAEEDLRRDFEILAEEAGTERTDFIFHRDFQSRNLMVHGGRLRLVDFQGMRFGRPVYDLASLLMDPYAALPPTVQRRLEARYRAAAGHRIGLSKREFDRTYPPVRLSRNLQVLAAYANLGLNRGKPQFLQYIPPALRSLRSHRILTGLHLYRDLWRILSEACKRAKID